MDANSQQKVIAAGFQIIREDDCPAVRIKVKNKEHREWATLEKFQSKAARDRRMKELLNDEMIISD
jgi:hypothetical protein